MEAPAGKDIWLPFKKMDLEQKSIERIKMASEMSLHHYGKPLVCTYSGGKDSDVMLELFKRSGVPFEAISSHTTVDAPQTVYHIRKVFSELDCEGIKCGIDYHIQPNGKRITMWNLMPKKLMPPTRLVRYCCATLKETYGKNRFIATGVRWDESSKRKEWGSISAPDIRIHATDEIMLMNDNDTKRKLVEQCGLKGKMVVNPIVDWTHKDVWEYIRSEHIDTNELYACGYDRVGCIGCPMAGKHRWKEFADFPEYEIAYILAFEKMILEREKRGKKTIWRKGEEVFRWWMEDKNVEGQMNLFEDGFIQ